MKVIAPGDVEIDLGITEVTPTIGIKDYSRRVTDDFGVTTVVPRAFARTMSVKFALPSSQVDAVQDALAELRATEAQWIAAEDFAWLNFAGFYKDFALDVAAGEKSFCSLTVEGLAETETVSDGGEDPSPTGPSTLMLIQPVTITTGTLSASNVPETDWPEWSNATVYADGAKVIKAATHRIYESLVAANVANDPAGSSGKWLDVGPTNRWAMFDQALGTATSRVGGITVTLAPGEADAIALLDVVGSTVRVQKGAYDETEPVVSGAASFIDLPGGSGNITVTVAGAGTVSVGTLIVGTLVTLGITEDRPSTGITDFSRKEVDDFGEATIVERAWSKRMTVGALIRTDAVDVVANRIAAVRTKPSLWIALRGTSALTIYGFFKDFGIEVGQAASKLSLSVEGLSKAAPAADIFEGLSIVEKTIYRRSASAPATPTGGSFDFDTMTATPPADWSISVPAGTDPVWVSDAIASKQGPGGTADFVGWSPPVIAFMNGASSFSLVNVSNMAITAPNRVEHATGPDEWTSVAGSRERYAAATVSIRAKSGQHIGFGLTADDGAGGATTFDYAFHATNAGALYVMRDWNPQYVGTYVDGDLLAISSDGGRVVYMKNGVELHAHTPNSSTEALRAVFSAYYLGDIIEEIAIAPGGRAGTPGTAGAPGAPGADGAPRFTWYAYADSLAPHYFNFATGTPGGRQFQGVAYNKTSPTESTNPADYAWSEYIGPPNFGLASFNTNSVVAGNKLIKVAGGNAWNASIHSTESYKGGASVSFIVDTTLTAFMVGLNTDPTTNASYDSIDYALYCASGTAQIYESGAGIAIVGSYAVGDVFTITYNGKSVIYSVVGVGGGAPIILRSVAAPAGLSLFLDTSLNDPGYQNGRILSFTAAGTAGDDGAPGDDGAAGAPGAPGATGNKTVRVYRRSGSAPSTPTGNVPPSGWSTSIPADDGTAVWASDVETQSNGTTVVGSYTTPVMFQAATPIGGGTTTIIIDSEAGSTASIKKFIVAGGTLPVTSRIRTQVAGGSGTQKLKIEWRVYGGSWATLGSEGSNAYAFGERGVVSKSETFTNSSGADQNYEFRATTSVTGSPAGVDETRSHITA